MSNTILARLRRKAWWLYRCRGDCECHRCCIPYDGEDGPHCEDCAPKKVTDE